MPPKRKAEEMDGASAKGKKTTVSTKTTVTTVTIEEPEAKKKPDALPKKPKAKGTSASLGNAPFPLPSSGPMGLPAGYGIMDPLPAPTYPLAGSGHRPSTPAILPRYDLPLSLPASSGQMPLQLPAIPGYGALAGPSSSLVTTHAMDAMKSDGGSGKFVWLIYHKSGRQDARLMGAYTGAKSALKNAKVVIDKETGGAEGRIRQGATLSDFSSNIQAEQGVIYEVKHQIGGGKDVVSFKKVRLNEDLGGDDC